MSGPPMRPTGDTGVVRDVTDVVRQSLILFRSTCIPGGDTRVGDTGVVRDVTDVARQGLISFRSTCITGGDTRYMHLLGKTV